MPSGRTAILDNSVHVKYILDCISKGISVPNIQKGLLQRGFKVSVPTIRNYVNRVKKKGININKFIVETESTALDINNKIKGIKNLSSIFNRRTYLIQTLLDRRNKMLEYAAEGPRTGWVESELEKLHKYIDEHKDKLPLDMYNEMILQIVSIQRYVGQNFLDSKCYPSIEDAIRKNTMDIHELCKYIEQWTSRYEVEALMEKLCEGLTKAAVNTFGPLLKRETENYRKQYIDKFLSEVDTLMNDLKSYQLEIEGEKYGSEK